MGTLVPVPSSRGRWATYSAGSCSRSWLPSGLLAAVSSGWPGALPRAAERRNAGRAGSGIPSGAKCCYLRDMTDKAEAERLQGIAARLVEEARRRGADVAEASASSGWELTTKVRLGKPELVQEAGTRSVALGVIQSQWVAVPVTSDWTGEGIGACDEDA